MRVARSRHVDALNTARTCGKNRAMASNAVNAKVGRQPMVAAMHSASNAICRRLNEAASAESERPNVHVRFRATGAPSQSHIPRKVRNRPEAKGIE